MGMLPLEMLQNEISKISKLDKETLLERYRLKDQYPNLELILENYCRNLTVPLSSNCGFDLIQYCNSLDLILQKNVTDFTETFLKVLDAGGKIGPGILRGHSNHYGLYSQCTAASHKFNNHTFTGNFVTLFFTANLAQADPASCSPASHLVMSIDLCLPDSCGKSDLEKFFSILSFSCGFADIRDQDRGNVAGTYIIIIIMCTCFALGITASIYDYYILPSHKDRAYTKSFPMKAWRAFSLYTNIVEIFNTKGANKPGNIGPLHCMRFFSMVWVITGHTLGFFMAFSANPLDILDITHDWGTQIVTSAYFAVDTFFWQVYNHSPMDKYCDSNWWIDLLYLNNFINYDKQMTVDYSYYTTSIYNAPWIRCQVYIIGLVTGYFLQNVKKLRIPWYVNLIGWIMTGAMVYGCIWSLQDWISGKGIEVGYSALYSATSKWTQYSLPIVVVSYLGAILWSSAFEFAFGKLEDAIISVLLGSGNKRPQQPQVKPAETNNQNESANNGAFEKASAPEEILSDSLRKRNGINEIPVIESNSVHTIRVSKKDEAWS
ncbi:hypothetical protein FO519_001186 [Halicephalobus sp. NKZ332]|nr:hypothetical protein FO519_001186 [Halicephalobus sp. NKZ332]